MATQPTQPTTGVVISISDNTPATEDQAGYEALSFTEIGEALKNPACHNKHKDNKNVISATQM